MLGILLLARAGETPIGANLDGESTETRRRIGRASLDVLRDFAAREVRITHKLAPMGETPALPPALLRKSSKPLEVGT
jgi:hypothetical protein